MQSKKKNAGKIARTLSNLAKMHKQQTRCKFVFIHRDKWLHSLAAVAAAAAADLKLNAKCFRISGHVQYSVHVI